VVIKLANYAVSRIGKASLHCH